MQPGLLEQGITLMLVGMGTVFVFLTLLVAAMSLMAMIVKKLTTTVQAGVASDEEIAAISAAITAHRKKNS